MQSPIELRFLRFPRPCATYGSQLINHIAKQFEMKNEGKIKIHIEEDHRKNIYDLEKMKEYLGPSDHAESYNMVEVDTAVLGEMVESKLLKPVHVNTRQVLPQAASAVTYKKNTYGFPTMVCSKFQVKATNLKEGESSQLIADFREPWTQATYYLNAYINKYGPSTLYRGVDSHPLEETVLKEIKTWYDTCGKLSNGKNICTEKLKSDQIIQAMIHSPHSTFVGYPEIIGEVLMKVKDTPFQISSIEIDTKKKYTLLYTDAVVINPHMDEVKHNASMDFIEYYTSTTFRLDLAFCKHSKQHCIRYHLPANLDFYSNSRLQGTLFLQFYNVVKSSGISAPNHKLCGKVQNIANELSKYVEIKTAN